ncbi:LRR receptor-like serine/threonine-protein kinase IRK precursor [Actinidia chinensis var. chinensis]|uniref:LRR receptor-like serine/threonine-protein kinase IRK n=1 Tax=Actinidia chinensis var. chinensis TaxID=1590841 RepID=A0A2R6S1M4_ACTCC|nr:LRR receptor-like serine/threonine-protein kinase IRK precursor [Actinidia chinensis var. chinensis]
MATAMVLEPPRTLPDPPASYDTTPSDENDLYNRLKSIQRQIEFIEIQEEYVKDELLVIGQFMIADADSSHLPSSVSLLPRHKPEREEANKKETLDSQASSLVATTLGMALAVGAQLSHVWWMCLATPSHSRAGKARVKTSNPVKPQPQSRMNCPAHIRLLGKYVLRRWCKNVKRAHTKVQICYNKSSTSIEARRYDNVRNLFNDVTDLAEVSQDKYDMVMTRVRELKQELMEASVVVGSNVVSLGDGMSIQEKDSFSLGDGVIPSKRSTNILDLEVAMVVSLVVVAVVVLEELCILSYSSSYLEQGLEWLNKSTEHERAELRQQGPRREWWQPTKKLARPGSPSGSFLLWFAASLSGSLRGRRETREVLARESYGCLEQERTALLQLKDFINHPHGDSLPTWEEALMGEATTDCCQWEGVKCNNTTGRVLQLSLESSLDIGHGYMNASMFLPFEELESLDLSWNSLEGWLPNEVLARESYGCLEQERTALLQLKDFINHPHGDSLPTWEEALMGEATTDCCQWEGVKCNNTTGRVLQLSLESSLDIGHGYMNASMFLPFEELESLDLSWNSLEGWLPNEGFEKLARLNNLEFLDLSVNDFNNSILLDLGGLTSLKTLSLRDNQLDGKIHIDKFRNLTNLQELDLGDNLIDGFITYSGALARRWSYSYPI